MERRYTLPGRTDTVYGAAAGQLVEVHLALVVPHETRYLALEDYIPAGAEVLDVSLQTSQQGGEASAPPTLYQEWLFASPQIFDDHILWRAAYLSPGTYEVTYLLVLNQPGEYRVLPARAYGVYFPELQGRSAGATFTITP